MTENEPIKTDLIFRFQDLFSRVQSSAHDRGFCSSRAQPTLSASSELPSHSRAAENQQDKLTHCHISSQYFYYAFGKHPPLSNDQASMDGAEQLRGKDLLKVHT